MAEKNSLWKNIRANRGSGKKPTAEMLRQEKKIKAKYPDGGPVKDGYLNTPVEQVNTGSLYNPVSNRIHSDPSDPSDALPHEYYHAWQHQEGRDRLPELYDGPLRQPQTPYVDELTADYYNRRGFEENAINSEFKSDNPSFNFVPDNVMYDKYTNAEMYNRPYTLEGEARATESPEGREWLKNEGMLPEGIENMYNAKGGPVGQYVPSGPGGNMPLDLPLKEQNPYLVPEYNQPMANGYILPDPQRPRVLPEIYATEYKTGIEIDGKEHQVPTIVGGQYIGDHAWNRYNMSGEEFKPTADPSSYSKFYDTIEPLGLMKDTREFSEGGYMYPDGGKTGKPKAKNKPTIEYTDPNLFKVAEQQYQDSLDTYNLSKKVIPNDFRKLPKIDKNKYDEIIKKDRVVDPKTWNFDNVGYDKDVKKGKTKEFKDYMYETPSMISRPISNFEEYEDKIRAEYPQYNENHPKKYKDADVVEKLKNGVERHYQTYQGELDKDNYVDVYPNGTERYNFYGDLEWIESPTIKPIDTKYFGKDEIEEINIHDMSSSSTGWYDPSGTKPKFKNKSNQRFSDTHYPYWQRDIYKEPTVRPVFKKSADKSNTPIVNRDPVQLQNLESLKLTNSPTQESPLELNLKTPAKRKAYINRGANSGYDANGNPLVSEINLGDGKGWKQVPYNTLDQYEEIKAAGGYVNQYATGSTVIEDELPTYRYANKEGVIGGPTEVNGGTRLPVNSSGTPVVNLPEFEVISTPTGHYGTPNPYSPITGEEFLNSGYNPVNLFLPPQIEKQQQPIDPKTGMPFPQSGRADFDPIGQLLINPTAGNLKNISHNLKEAERNITINALNSTPARKIRSEIIKQIEKSNSVKGSLFDPKNLEKLKKTGQIHSGNSKIYADEISGLQYSSPGSKRLRSYLNDRFIRNKNFGDLNPSYNFRSGNFSAAVTLPENYNAGKLSDFTFFDNNKISAGRTAKNLEDLSENIPGRWEFNAGSLSGDSYPMWMNIVNRKNNLDKFGIEVGSHPNNLNDMGKFSELANARNAGNHDEVNRLIREHASPVFNKFNDKEAIDDLLNLHTTYDPKNAYYPNVTLIKKQAAGGAVGGDDKVVTHVKNANDPAYKKYVIQKRLAQFSNLSHKHQGDLMRDDNFKALLNEGNLFSESEDGWNKYMSTTFDEDDYRYGEDYINDLTEGDYGSAITYSDSKNEPTTGYGFTNPKNTRAKWTDPNPDANLSYDVPAFLKKHPANRFHNKEYFNNLITNTYQTRNNKWRKPNTKPIEDDTNLAELQKTYPKLTQKDLDSDVVDSQTTPRYSTNFINRQGQSINRYSSEFPDERVHDIDWLNRQGIYYPESIVNSIDTNVISIPEWDEPENYVVVDPQLEELKRKTITNLSPEEKQLRMQELNMPGITMPERKHVMLNQRNQPAYGVSPENNHNQDYNVGSEYNLGDKTGWHNMPQGEYINEYSSNGKTIKEKYSSYLDYLKENADEYNIQGKYANGGYTMKNNNQSWKQYLYEGGKKDKKRKEVLASPLNEGPVVGQPAIDWASNWVNNPEFVLRLNENFPTSSRVKDAEKFFTQKSGTEIRANRENKAIQGAFDYMPKLTADIKDTEFLYNANPAINEQLFQNYTSTYTPEDMAEVAKKLKKNPQAVTEPYGTAIVRDHAADIGQAGATSAAGHEIFHQITLPTDKLDVAGNRIYDTIDNQFGGKFAMPLPSTWTLDDKGKPEVPSRKELYPMLMQLRMDNQFKPGEIIDDSRLDQIRKAGSSNPLLKYYNNEQLKKYLNTFASNKSQSPDAQYAAEGGYYPTQGPGKALFKGYAEGGYTNPYNMYHKDPHYQYKVGGKVWQGIGSAAYGVLSGTLNTVTGGLTTSIMDKGEDALQKAANKNFDPNNPEDVKAMRQIDTAGASGEIGGSWLGLTLNPGNIGSAVAGTGKGTNDIIQASTASDEAKQWSQGLSGLAQMGHMMNGMGSGSSSGSTSGSAGAGAEGATASASAGATAAGEGASSFGDIMTNFSGTKFGKNAKQAMPFVNQAAGMAGNKKGSLLEQGQQRQDFINSPEYLAQETASNQAYANQGLKFETGGNITNNSLNLRNTMRYKKFAKGGTFDQYGINYIPESAGLHHESAYGGVPIGPDALAEGGEIKMDTGDGGQYIVSDQVDGAESQKDFTFSKGGKYKELDRTLADGMKQDLNRYTFGGLATSSRRKEDLRRPNDSYAQSTIDQIKDRWQKKTEFARQRSQQEQAIAQAESQKKLIEEEFIAAYGGKINPKKYPGLNRAKGGYVHNQMTQPMYAVGGPVYGDPASPYTYAMGGPDKPWTAPIPIGSNVQQGSNNIVSAGYGNKDATNSEYGSRIINEYGNGLPNDTSYIYQSNKMGANPSTEDYFYNTGQNTQDRKPVSNYNSGSAAPLGNNVYQDRIKKLAGYARGGMYGDPYYRGGEIDYTNDMYAGGGPMVSNVNQPFKGPAAQNRGGMYIYPDGGMMEGQEQMPQEMQEQPQQQMQEQQGGQDQMMQMVQQVAQAIAGGANPEEVMQQLVQSGVPPEQAQQIIQAAMQMASQQQQQQPMQGQGQMIPQGMAQGGMMQQQSGAATKIAEALQQGAQPQEVLQQLVDNGMPQEQAMSMVQAVMGQLKNQMQQQQPQQQMMAPQQPMMAARGGYFNGRKQYPWGGNDGDVAPPPIVQKEEMFPESWQTTAAGLAQAVPGIAGAAYSFGNLKNRKLTPSLTPGVTVDYTPERIALQEEGRRGISMALDAMKRNAPTSGSYTNNAKEAVLRGNKIIGGQISKSWQDQKNEQAKYDFETGKNKADTINKVNELNEGMYQNAMEQGFRSSQDAVSKVANYYTGKEGRDIQRWQAQNTNTTNHMWHSPGPGQNPVQVFKNAKGEFWYGDKRIG